MPFFGLTLPLAKVIATSGHDRHLVFDQQKAVAAPPTLGVRQTILPPVSIHVDEPVAEGHRRQVQDPRHRHPEILQRSQVLGRRSMLWMESLNSKAVSTGQPRGRWNAKVVPSVRTRNWSEFRRLLVHQQLHLVEQELCPPHRWLQDQSIIFSSIWRDQPWSLGPTRPLPRILIASVWIFTRFNRWTRHRHVLRCLNQMPKTLDTMKNPHSPLKQSYF